MVQQLIHKQFSNQTLRILTALCLIPFVVAIIWLGTPYVDILAIGTAVMLLKEWTQMSLGVPSTPFPYVMLSLTLATLYLDLSGVKYLQYSSIAASLFLVAQGFQGRVIKNLVFHILGTLYISWSIYLIIYFCYQGLTFYFLWILTVVWACDSGAYFIGKNIGGPKLAPHISPNKTWSGFLGGLFTSMIVGTILGFYLQDFYKTWWQMSVISFYFALISHLGDLLESRVKRYFDVKDSGCLIPGHGGFLDRLDSTLLASFAAGLLMILTL